MANPSTSTTTVDSSALSEQAKALLRGRRNRGIGAHSLPYSGMLLTGVDALDNVIIQTTKTAMAAADPFIAGSFPEYASGARCYVLVAGRKILEAQGISYEVSASNEALRTIDMMLPWDIVVHSVTIRANLQSIIDPRTSAETQGLRQIMKSIMHQPMIDIQVIDRSGAELFWARGMFVRCSESIRHGALGVRSADFEGIAYAGNVTQSFSDY